MLHQHTGWRAWNHQHIARLQLVSVVVVIVISMAHVIATRGAVGLGWLEPHSEGCRRAMTLHEICAVYLGLLPGLPFALGGYLLGRVPSEERGSTFLGWASLCLYWSGALIVIISAFNGEVDTGLNYIASYRSGHRGAVIALSAGLFIVSLACWANAHWCLRRFFSEAREPGVYLWARLMWMTAIVQALLLPAKAALLLLVGFGPVRGNSLLAHWINEPTLPHQLLWFTVQPAILSTFVPVVGYVSASLGALSPVSSRQSRLVFHAALSYSILGFASWGIQCASLGQSTRMTVLFSAVSLILLVPISMPAVVWLDQLRRMPSGFRNPSWVPVSAIAMLAVCAAIAMILFSPVSGTDEVRHALQYACLCLLGVSLLVILLGGDRRLLSSSVAPTSEVSGTRRFDNVVDRESSSRGKLLNASP